MLPAKLLTITFAHNTNEEKSPIVDFFSSLLLTHTNKYYTIKANNNYKNELYNLDISSNVKTIGKYSLITYQVSWANINEEDDSKIFDYLLSVFTNRTKFNKKIYEQLKSDFRSHFSININNYGFANTYYLTKTIFDNSILSNYFIDNKLLSKISYHNLKDYYLNTFLKSNVNIIANFESINLNKFISCLNESFSNDFKIYDNQITLTSNKKKEFKLKNSPVILSYVYHLTNMFPNLSYLNGLLLNEFIGGNQASFLFNEIREKKRLAYHLESSFDRFTGTITIYVITDNINNIKLINNVVTSFFKADFKVNNFDKMKDFLIENIKLDGDDIYEYQKEKLLFKMFNLDYIIDDKINYLNNLDINDINEVRLSAKLIYEQIVSQDDK